MASATLLERFGHDGRIRSEGRKKMRKMISQFAGVFLFCVAGASIASAQCPNPLPGSNNFCLSGVGNGNSLDGIYVSPYQALINGVPTYVICDDFVDDVNLYESWATTSGTVGSSTVGLFGAENSAGYAEVAWLSEQLMANLSSPSQQDLLSYAIWAVFDPGTPTTGVQGYLDANGGLSWSAVQTELTAASSHTSDNFSNVTIYTPTGGETAGGSPRAQEFVVVSTPEASTVANLAIDFLAFGALLFVFRRNRLATR